MLEVNFLFFCSTPHTPRYDFAISSPPPSPLSDAQFWTLTLLNEDNWDDPDGALVFSKNLEFQEQRLFCHVGCTMQWWLLNICCPPCPPIKMRVGREHHVSLHCHSTTTLNIPTHCGGSRMLHYYLDTFLEATHNLSFRLHSG